MTELSFSKSFLSILDSRSQKLPPDYSLPAQDLEITAPYTLPRMPTPMRRPTAPLNSSTSSTTAPATNTGSTSSVNPATASAAAGSEPSITITLKSSRPGASAPNGPLVLHDIPISTTSVLDLKQSFAAHIGLRQKNDWESIKVLYMRKPISDNTKTVKEILGGEEGIRALLSSADGKKEGAGGGGKLEIEFGVMVLGGGSGGGSTSSTAAAAASSTTSASKERTGPTQQNEDDDPLATQQFWDDLKGFLMQRLKHEGKAETAYEVFQEAWKAKAR